MKLTIELEITKDEDWKIDGDRLVNGDDPDDQSMFLLDAENVMLHIVVRTVEDPPFMITDAKIISFTIV